MHLAPLGSPKDTAAALQRKYFRPDPLAHLKRHQGNVREWPIADIVSWCTRPLLAQSGLNVSSNGLAIVILV